ncbi:N,N-dimethylformamidase beta subunit family domain-containing protein, partial [Rhizobium ruizarguesonis]
IDDRLRLDLRRGERLLDGADLARAVPASNIVFQTSDTKWQAYNDWGGASLYYGEVPVDPADMIGYLPPNCSCGLQAIGRASAVS